MNVHTTPPATEPAPQQHDLMPPLAKVREVAHDPRDEIHQDFAQRWSAHVVADETERHESVVTVCEMEEADLDATIHECSAAIDDAPTHTIARQTATMKGYGVPVYEVVYSAIKVIFAFVAPLMGVSLLATKMADHSFAFYENPWLALLAAGPLFLGSYFVGTWILSPSEVERSEVRLNWVARLTGAVFALWAGSMAVTYGLPVEEQALGGGFDPTAPPAPGGVAPVELLLDGIAVLALFTHLVGEALLAGWLTASALLTPRKLKPEIAVLKPIASEQIDRREAARARRSEVRRQKADAEGAIRRCERLQEKLFADVLAAIRAERQRLEASLQRAQADATREHLNS